MDKLPPPPPPPQPQIVKVWFEVGYKPPKRMNTSIKIVGGLRSTGKWLVRAGCHTLQHDESSARDVYSSHPNALEIDLNELKNSTFEYRYFVWNDDEEKCIEEEKTMSSRRLPLAKKHVGRTWVVHDYTFNDLSRPSKVTEYVRRSTNPYDDDDDDPYDDY
eukprot:Selendium_serpulae@DN6331_c3_g1_i2.p1